MRKKFFAGTVVKKIAEKTIGKKIAEKTVGKNLRKITPEFKEAIEKHKKLLNKYKNKPLDKDAVKQSYRIFTKNK